MSLRFQYPKLALEVRGQICLLSVSRAVLIVEQVLEILTVVCTFGGVEGVTQTVMGLRHLARVRREKPFEILVDAMRLPVSHFFLSMRLLVFLPLIATVLEPIDEGSRGGSGECHDGCQSR